MHFCTWLLRYWQPSVCRMVSTAVFLLPYSRLVACDRTLTHPSCCSQSECTAMHVPSMQMVWWMNVYIDNPTIYCKAALEKGWILQQRARKTSQLHITVLLHVFPTVPQECMDVCDMPCVFGNVWMTFGNRSKQRLKDQTEQSVDRTSKVTSNSDVVLSQFRHKKLVG